MSDAIEHFCNRCDRALALPLPVILIIADVGDFTFCSLGCMLLSPVVFQPLRREGGAA